MNITLQRTFRALTILALPLSVSFALAQEPMLQPPAALGLENVPVIPARLATLVGKYTEFKPTGFTDWHPTRLEMLITRRHVNTTQIYRLSKPGGTPQLLTDYAEPVRIASYQPRRGDYVLFGKDSGGNEVFRLHRKASGAAAAVAGTAISPDNKRMQSMAWSNRGDRVVYTTVPVNRKGSQDTVNSDVHIADPAGDLSKSRVIASLPGGGWDEFVFSPDDRQLAMVEGISANESYIWIMDIATGEKQRLTDKDGDVPIAYGAVKFSRDGRGIYTVTDRGSEFQRLTYIDIKTKAHKTLTADINWDVEDWHLSHDGKLIAFISNEDGTGVLHIRRTADGKSLPTPALPLGTLRSVRWHRDSTNLAIEVASAKSPSDVFAYNVKTAKLTRWTAHEQAPVDPANFVEPTLVRWKSFDDRLISGFVYRAPTAKFSGKRPVLVNIHGGPEGQFQPGFMGRANYITDELGITQIYPNVRGSSGYGKSFLKLDNWRLREDSVKDIAALFDWIATQPELDASRIMVSGGSYGGYMSLAVSTLYADRITAAIDVVGISNFVTFLENTESYRRDLRRVEYGDERDPDMRKFMEGISPLNRAAQITKPLFVVQGKNDPRVPVTEAEQIVATLKKSGTPVWYMVAADEGHGFAKKANADYQFFASTEFMRRYLLDK